MGVVIYLLINCIITVVTEVILLVVYKKNEYILPCVIMNVISNPILNLLLPAIYYVCGYALVGSFILKWLALLIMEGLVIVGEALILKFFLSYPFDDCIKHSAWLNITSFIVGLIINSVFQLSFTALVIG